jgi:hypothetical protein
MRQYSAEEAMEISNKITGVTSLLIGAVVAFAIGIILVKLLWAWTIPDLFPVVGLDHTRPVPRGRRSRLDRR